MQPLCRQNGFENARRSRLRMPSAMTCLSRGFESSWQFVRSNELETRQPSGDLEG